MLNAAKTNLEESKRLGVAFHQALQSTEVKRLTIVNIEKRCPILANNFLSDTHISIAFVSADSEQFLPMYLHERGTKFPQQRFTDLPNAFFSAFQARHFVFCFCLQSLCLLIILPSWSN